MQLDEKLHFLFNVAAQRLFYSCTLGVEEVTVMLDEENTIFNQFMMDGRWKICLVYGSGSVVLGSDDDLFGHAGAGLTFFTLFCAINTVLALVADGESDILRITDPEEFIFAERVRWVLA